ncbi:hypothetical protein CCPUN_03910 [Cardinium endosymbiont of Culicoides punctatus]|nr:hypothetical protein CCPUN_03910 [Cardinium endosymbiont of Culicoides punctatus]
MLKNKQIPNPNKISKDEHEFVENVSQSISGVLHEISVMII